jgi:RNA polymerase sigma-70 factor (ECF subfamily)
MAEPDLPAAGRPPPPQDGTSISTTLLSQLQSGSQDGWRRLDHLFRPTVVAWCRGAGLASEVAEDLTQEVFLAVAGHIQSFRRQRPGDSFRGWLWRITQNKIRDHFRRAPQQAASPGGTAFQERLRQVAEELSLSHTPPPMEGEEAAVYQRALELIQHEFEPRTMQAFLKLVVEGKSPQAVADELGMSKGAVYTAKSRVLARLRKEFEDLLD